MPKKPPRKKRVCAKGGNEVMSMRKKSNREPIDDYLWDGSGRPQPEIQHLEKMLAEFRHSGNELDFSALPATVQPNLFQRFLRIAWVPRFASAAVIALAILSGAALLFFPAAPGVSTPGWQVARVAGTPLVGAIWTSASHSSATLQVGQSLVTNQDSRATIAVGQIGEIQVEPGSRVRLLQSSDNRKRIALDRGTILAAIWAPPGEFVVDTPSAVAVDLGCAYTLQVAPDGSGVLRTTLGWVGFHLNGRDSFIPAGAMCSTRRGTGPGTPYFEDAPESFHKDRKSTRLNSSHPSISYAVFCLKKKTAIAAQAFERTEAVLVVHSVRSLDPIAEIYL